jgi:hypothetical protein
MDYIMRFCEKHDLNFEGWVGDRVGGTAEIGDMLLDFSDIRYDIDTEQKVGTIEKWWDYSYGLAMLECPKTINYRSWCAGAPVPYSQEQLNKISQAHNDVETAKQVLEDLLNGGDY